MTARRGTSEPPTGRTRRGPVVAPAAPAPPSAPAQGARSGVRGAVAAAVKGAAQTASKVVRKTVGKPTDTPVEPAKVASGRQRPSKAVKTAPVAPTPAGASGGTRARGRASAASAPDATVAHAPRLSPDYPAEVWRRLAVMHPDAHCELAYRDAFELLCATILSAQCTDRRVNMVTPTLFAAYPDARALAAARQEDVEAIVKSTGFFRSKAKNLIAMAQALVAGHDGVVPSDMASLVMLPGVGRKTANVILGNAYGINEGVTVDTHVARLAQRLGFTSDADPVRIEQALMPRFPRAEWAMLSHRLIFHGRRICEARKPRCFACGLADICPSSAVPAAEAPAVARAALAAAPAAPRA
jgi:endonuclease-3